MNRAACLVAAHNDEMENEKRYRLTMSILWYRQAARVDIDQTSFSNMAHHRLRLDAIGAHAFSGYPNQAAAGERDANVRSRSYANEQA